MIDDKTEERVKKLLSRGGYVYLRLTLDKQGELQYEAIVERNHGSRWWQWSAKAKSITSALRLALKDAKPGSKKKGKKRK